MIGSDNGLLLSRIASVQPDASVNPKRIAIVGTAENTFRMAPWGDPSWEVWGLNSLHTHNLGQWDRWFNLHHEDFIRRRSPEHWQWLTQQDGTRPIYLQRATADVPGSCKFPFAELMQEFKTKYFTNTVSWLMAFAISRGCQDLGLFGVDMAMPGEYSHQRPSCEYFCGIAQGRGINLHLPACSNLLKCHAPYGIDDTSPLSIKLRDRERELSARIEEFDRELESLRDKRWAFVGALEQTRLTQQFIPAEVFDPYKEP